MRSLSDVVNADLTDPDDEIEMVPVEGKAPVVEKELVAKAEDALASYLKTPKEMWEESLSEFGIKKEEAFGILDTIMTRGKYEAGYKVGSLLIKMRTRTTVDTDRLVETLQKVGPDTRDAYNHVVSRVNLASSLVSFGDNTFQHTDPSDNNRKQLDNEWMARYKFCEKLPAPVYESLVQLLARFDARVNISCDARSIDNF